MAHVKATANQIYFVKGTTPIDLVGLGKAEPPRYYFHYIHTKKDTMQRSDWQVPPSEQTVTLVELRNLVTRSDKKRHWKVLNLCLVSNTTAFLAE